MNKAEIKQAFSKRITIRGQAASLKVLIDKRMKQLEQELQMVAQAERKKKCDLIGLQGDRVPQSTLNIEALPSFKGVICATTASGLMSQDPSIIFNLAKGQGPSSEQPNLQDYHVTGRSLLCESASSDCKKLCASPGKHYGAGVQDSSQVLKIFSKNQESFVFEAAKARGTNTTMSSVATYEEGKPSEHVGSTSDSVNVINIVATPTKLSRLDESKCSSGAKRSVLTKTGQSTQSRQKQHAESARVHLCNNSKDSNIEVKFKENFAENSRWNSKGVRKSLQRPLAVIPEEPFLETKNLSLRSSIKESGYKHTSEATPFKSQILKKSAELFSSCGNDIELSIRTDGFWDCVTVDTAASNSLPEPSVKKSAGKASWKDTCLITFGGTGKRKLQKGHLWHSEQGKHMFQKARRKGEHKNLTRNINRQGQTDMARLSDISQPDDMSSKSKLVKFVSSRYKNAGEPKKEKTTEKFKVEDPICKAACWKIENQHCLEKEPSKRSKYRSTSGNSAFGKFFLNAVDPHPSAFKESPACIDRGNPGEYLEFAGKGPSFHGLDEKTLCDEKGNFVCSSSCQNNSKSMLSESEVSMASEEPIEDKAKKLSIMTESSLYKTVADEAASASSSGTSKLEPESLESATEACNETVADVGKLKPHDSVTTPPSANVASNDHFPVKPAVPKDSNGNEHLSPKTTRGESTSQLSVSNIPNCNTWKESVQERCGEASPFISRYDDLAINSQESRCNQVTRLESPIRSASNIESNFHISSSSNVPKDLMSSLCLPTSTAKLEVITARVAAKRLLEFLHEQNCSTFFPSKRSVDCGRDGTNGGSSGNQECQGNQWKETIDSKDQNSEWSMQNMLPETTIEPEGFLMCSQDILNKFRSADQTESSTAHEDLHPQVLSPKFSGSSQNSFLQEKEGQCMSLADHVSRMNAAETHTSQSQHKDQSMPVNGGSSFLKSWDSTLLSLTKQVKDLDDRLRCVTFDMPSFGLVASGQEEHSCPLPKTQETLLTLEEFSSKDQCADDLDRGCNPSVSCDGDGAREMLGHWDRPDYCDEHLIKSNHDNLENKPHTFVENHFQESDKEDNQSIIMKPKMMGIQSNNSPEVSSVASDLLDSGSQVSSTSSSFKSSGSKGKDAYLDGKAHFLQMSSFLNPMNGQITQVAVSEARSRESLPQSQLREYSSVSVQSRAESRAALMNSGTDIITRTRPVINAKEHISGSEKRSVRDSSSSENVGASCTLRLSKKELRKLKLEATTRLEDVITDKGAISAYHRNLTTYSSDDISTRKVGTKCLLECLQEKYLEMSSKEHSLGALILLPEKPSNVAQAQLPDSHIQLEGEAQGRQHIVLATSMSILNTGSHCSSVNLEDGWGISDAESLSLLSGSVDFSSWSVSELPDIFTPRERLQNYLNHTVKQMQPLSKSMQKSSLRCVRNASRIIKCRQQQVRVQIKGKKLVNSSRMSQLSKGMKSVTKSRCPGTKNWSEHQHRKGNSIRLRIPANYVIQQGGKHFCHHKMGCRRAYRKRSNFPVLSS
ncbi:hypothetical protein O6H91_02G002600 [Diphasiastrum complanatum]|nr:hypothetical protein O6H91_02G002600 [Diphasiastrum complanatum]